MNSKARTAPGNSMNTIPRRVMVPMTESTQHLPNTAKRSLLIEIGADPSKWYWIYREAAKVAKGR